MEKEKPAVAQAPQRGLSDSQSEIRRRLRTYIDHRHELLRRIDDGMLTELVTYLRSLEADPNFNPEEFLAHWLFGHEPSLGGSTPAEVLNEPGGLTLVKDTLNPLRSDLYHIDR